MDDYNSAILHGIVKIASKMGISTIQSYQGSKIFEAIGIDSKVVDEYFTGTVSRVGGITLDDIAKQADELHSAAFDPLGLNVDLTLESVGRHKSRSGGRSTCIIPRPFISYRSPQSAAITGCSRNIQSLLMERRTGDI